MRFFSVASIVYHAANLSVFVFVSTPPLISSEMYHGWRGRYQDIWERCVMKDTQPLEFKTD